jgi:hypothetical protein
MENKNRIKLNPDQGLIHFMIKKDTKMEVLPVCGLLEDAMIFASLKLHELPSPSCSALKL